MQAKIAWTVAAAWLVLFVTSFFALQLTAPAGDGSTRGLNRIVAFMTWQGAAFALAIVGALLTYRFGGAGGKHGKLLGYVPLACSVLLMGMLVAIIAFQVLVVPMFT
jgi:hypothetical protein